MKDASDIQDTIEIMEKILEPIKGNTRYFSYSFDFFIGNMRCSGKDKKEFLREIFGLTDFYLKSIGISVHSKKSSLKIIAHLYLSNYSGWEIDMSSESKDILMEIGQNHDRCINEIANPPSESIVIGTYFDNSQHVSVNGDINQSVIGNNNTITDSCQNDSHIENSTPESKNSFWRPVLQSLTTKIIWWGLTLLGAALFFYFAYVLKFKQV